MRKMSLMYRREVSLVRSYLTTGNKPPDQKQDEFIPIHGVIFDMDGTLTKPILNFTEMREAVGVPPSRDILEYIHSMATKEEKDRAFKIIEDIEERANKKMELRPGALEILNFLAGKSIKRALLTRNTRHSADLCMLRLQDAISLSPSSYPHLLSTEIFSKIVPRDFIPHKPHPAPVLHICDEWSLPSEHVLVVGDDKGDVTSGHEAGAVTALLVNKPQEGVSTYQPDESTPCDVIVTSLFELLNILQNPITIPNKNNKD